MSLTADLDRFRSLTQYRDRIELGIARAKQNATSRISDIRTAAALLPDRASEIQALENVVMDSISQAKSSAGIVSASPITRLLALLHLWKTGAYPDERIRQILLTFIPRLYLRYKRYSLRRR